MQIITKTEMLARTICVLVGITPIDPMDGSSNWWMFNNDAQKILADLKGRGFFRSFDHNQFGPEYGPYED